MDVAITEGEGCDYRRWGWKSISILTRGRVWVQLLLFKVLLVDAKTVALSESSEHRIQATILLTNILSYHEVEFLYIYTVRTVLWLVHTLNKCDEDDGESEKPC